MYQTCIKGGLRFITLHSHRPFKKVGQVAKLGDAAVDGKPEKMAQDQHRFPYFRDLLVNYDVKWLSNGFQMAPKIDIER